MLRPDRPTRQESAALSLKRHRKQSYLQSRQGNSKLQVSWFSLIRSVGLGNLFFVSYMPLYPMDTFYHKSGGQKTGMGRFFGSVAIEPN